MEVPMITKRLFRRRYTETGAIPGTIAIERPGPEPELHVLSFDEQTLTEKHPAGPEGLREFLSPDRVTWIDVQGLGDGSVVRRIGEELDLHRLALADVTNAGQRPKIEAYDDFLFAVLRMVTPTPDGGIGWEQISLFLGGTWVATFQELPGDCLDPLRERVRAGRRTLRSSSSGYLAVMVMDAIVDGYFPILERYGDELEDIEDRILERSDPEALQELYRIKRELVLFRRACWPLRDAIGRQLHQPDQHLPDAVIPYLRDINDHVLQVVEVNEGYRELTATLVDLYLSTVGQRTNETMRVLTVIATIFIPLTFLAGIYGMNFDPSSPSNMPELGWRYGYLAFWTVSLTIVGALLLTFRRLGWLGGR